MKVEMNEEDSYRALLDVFLPVIVVAFQIVAD